MTITEKIIISVIVALLAIGLFAWQWYVSRKPKGLPDAENIPPPPDENWQARFKAKISVMNEEEFLEEYKSQIGHPNPTYKDDWKLQHMIQICHQKALQQ